MNSFALAKIVLIEESDNYGYTKLILANQVPWKTQYLSFCVWNKKKLMNHHDDKTYGIGDAVLVEYKRPGRFLRLLSLKPTKVVACTVCGSFQEIQFDLQQVDQKHNCNTCSLYDADKRDRLAGELVLIANNERECAYSKGRCLTFVNEMTDELYFSWSFPNKPYFEVLSALETRKLYRVKGWIKEHTNDGNFVIELTDVPDLI